MTPASWSLNPAGTWESGMAKESQARWKISPWSLRTLTPTGQSTERRADRSPTLSKGEGGKLWPESHSWDLPTRLKTDLIVARFFLTEAQGSYCTQFLMGQGEDGRKLEHPSFLDSFVNSPNIYWTFLSLVIKNKISL